MPRAGIKLRTFMEAYEFESSSSMRLSPVDFQEIGAKTWLFFGCFYNKKKHFFSDHRSQFCCTDTHAGHYPASAARWLQWTDQMECPHIPHGLWCDADALRHSEVKARSPYLDLPSPLPPLPLALWADLVLCGPLASPPTVELLP